MAASLSRAQALGLIGLIWAAIYLPAFGSLEIKGEEGRRILPGITMLESGHWLVPSVGGVDYFSKPPLINWAIAGAIRLSGRQNEWSARVPSVLCVLALGAGTVWWLADWLGAAGALLAAIFMLTGIGMMEKGRLAEIEAMYISLFGLAVVSWLGLWQKTRLARDPERVAGSGAVWRAWTLPWLFLGLGLLTKGPLHLVFFYALIIGILLAARRTRELWSWPHLAGVLLMLAIFAAWAVPCLRQTAGERASQVWSNQLTNRLEIDETFRAGMWALNIPRGLANFLPWAVLLPLLWWRRPGDLAGDPGIAADWNFLRGGRWALAACFLGVSLAPGSLPRYSMPLLAPASVLLALVCVRRERVFGPLPSWLAGVWARSLILVLLLAGVGMAFAARAGGGGWRWAVGAVMAAASAWLIARTWRLREAGNGALPAVAVLSAAAMAVLTLDYAIGAVPRLRSRERLRPLAAHLNAVVGGDAPVYAYHPGFLPLLFYLHPSAHYAQRIETLPASAHFLLVDAKDEALIANELHAAGFQVTQSITLDHLSRGTWYLLRLESSAQ